MTFVLALEACDGATATFTSPVPWDKVGPTPTINGRTRTVDYVLVGTNQVRFIEPPGYDDVVGFFLTPQAT